MNDTDKTTKIQIDLAASGLEQVQAANEALKQLDQTAARAADDSERYQAALEAMDKQGEQARVSALKHEALKKVLGELGQLSPGLGEALGMVSNAYKLAGENAKTGAVGVTEFTAALDEVLLSTGPLVVAMLGIQAAMQYWDLYQEKVKAAAEAQAEAAKKIQESTKTALGAVRELEAAMHPRAHGTVEKDEETLKHHQRDLENAYHRQKELNRAQEENELKNAGSPEAKDQIHQRFEVMDKQLDDWRNRQNAALEGTMIGTMEKQLSDLEAAKQRLIHKMSGEFQYGKETGDMSRYNQTGAQLQQKADEAKAIREKLDELKSQLESDTTNAAFNSETNRQVFAARGIQYAVPRGEMPSASAGLDEASNRFATGKSIADTISSGRSHSPYQDTFLVTLEQAITGQKLTLNQAVTLMEDQARNQQFAAQLLGNVWQRVAQVERTLDQLGAQHDNARNHYGNG